MPPLLRQFFDHNVPESHAADVLLQADMVAGGWLFRGVIDDGLAVEFYSDAAAFNFDFEFVPLVVFASVGVIFTANEAAGGEWIVGRGDIEFIAVVFDAGGLLLGAEEDAAVGALGGLELQHDAFNLCSQPPSLIPPELDLVDARLKVPVHSNASCSV